MDQEASNQGVCQDLTAIGVQKAIATWSASKERVYQRERAFKRVADRALYRLAQEGKGLAVRAYRHHDYEPKRPEEDHEEYERRKHRDRGRERRGVTAESVRSWTDLSALSPDEKAAHKRAQAAARKRRGRAKRLELPASDLDHVNVDELL